MPTPLAASRPAARRRRAGVAVGVLAVLVVLLLSQGFGRAVPTNNYRPLPTVDALATGCFPLPGDARPDLAYQVRRDGDVTTSAGPRRELRGQYDLVDRDEAERRLVAAFTAVGFRESGAEGDAVVLTRGAERVAITVTALPGTDAETLVRGTFVLDLPVVAVTRPDDPLCRDPKSTKRWGER